MSKDLLDKIDELILQCQREGVSWQDLRLAIHDSFIELDDGEETA